VNYYRRYVGDYLRDTARLSMLEHGAYNLLLDYYYAERQPLSLELEEIYRATRALRPEERRAVDKVLLRYFDKRKDGYHNLRADQELEKFSHAIEKMSEAGLRGAKARWGKDRAPYQNPNRVDDRVTMQPPTSNLQPTTKSKDPRDANASVIGFENLWHIYPKRAGNNPKRRAQRCYSARLAEKHTPTEMLAGAERYAKFCALTGKTRTELVLQCATFLGPDKPFLQSWESNGKSAEWWRSENATLEKGREVGVATRPGESMHEYRERIRSAIAGGEE
jgi:uncharacterized protein YdaU (DUF1376 family)